MNYSDFDLELPKSINLGLQIISVEINPQFLSYLLQYFHDNSSKNIDKSLSAY